MKLVANSILNIEQTGICVLFTDVLCYIDRAADLMAQCSFFFFFFLLNCTLWALLVSLVSTKVVKLGNNRACSRTKQGHNDHTGKKTRHGLLEVESLVSLVKSLQSPWQNYWCHVSSPKSQAQTDHILNV